MRAVPEKIRSGLVELRTRSGLVCVSPSFAERIYLLWTFRNFPRLPKEVLNRHQRELIERLGRTAVVRQRAPVARTSLIGAVENVELLPERKPEIPARAEKIITMNLAEAARVAPQAVGAMPMPGCSAEKNQSGFGRRRQPSAEVQSISLPKPASVGQSAVQNIAAVRRGAKHRGWLVGAVVACCSVLLLGVPYYARKLRPAKTASVSRTAVDAHERSEASIPRIPPASATRPQTIPPSMPLQHDLPVKTRPDQPSPIVSTILRESTPPPEPHPAVASADSIPVPRVQIAGPPLSGFTYPTVPNATLTGKVSLKALIAPDGSVASVDVVSGDRTLARAAAQAVRHWRYGSRELNGNAAEAETNIVISFAGEDAVSISFPQ